MKNKSTALQLLRFLDEVSIGLDEGHEVHVLYTDIEKAFDRVPHKRLLIKLQKYGIDEKILAWIEDFLTGRKFRVRVNDSYSEWYGVDSGVPQGSVLGKGIFVIYINDLVEVVENGGLLLFADDAKIFKKISKDEDCLELQKSIDKVLAWFNKWLMSVNVDKCKIMRFGGKGTADYKYYMNNNLVKEVKSIRDLGVIMQADLKFKDHIHEIVNKAYSILGVIKRNFDKLDSCSFVRLYTSLVRSKLEYAVSVWSPQVKGLQRELEKVQRRATKIPRQCRNLSYGERLKYFNLPSLSYRRNRGDMIETFKILHGYYDKTCFPGLRLKELSRTRGNVLKLEVQGSHKNIRSYSFSMRVVKLWNDLPNSVVCAESVNDFKNKLDNVWMSRRFVYV